MGITYFVHERAIVCESVILGDGVKVWADCQIRKNANIGSNTSLAKGVYIGINVQVGKNCKIQNYANIFCGVSVGDDVFIGPNACFTNDKIPRAFNGNWRITETKVMQGASIGANATIVCGVTIGKYAIVGAGSVVTKDVEDYSVVVGNPAKHVHYVDIMGNKQCEKTQQDICEIN